MKIVILDGFTANPGDLTWDGFAALGELELYQRTDSADFGEIIRKIGDAEAVITINTPLGREIFEKCSDLKYVGLLATGYDMIDVKAAGEFGITVTTVPSYATAAVSQAAIALLLEVCNRAGYHSDAVKAGRWTSCGDWCFWDYPLVELSGKTVGIIGFGKIGQATGRIAKTLGMHVIAYDEYPNEAGKQIGEYRELDSLLSDSDVIILHCPLLPGTRGMINASSLSKMKDGVIIINNSRGQLIVESDLAEALNRGKVSAVGLDVTEHEPIEADNPLLESPNCILTPHISWAARESRQRLIEEAEKNLAAFAKGEKRNANFIK